MKHSQGESQSDLFGKAPCRCQCVQVVWTRSHRRKWHIPRRCSSLVAELSLEARLLCLSSHWPRHASRYPPSVPQGISGSCSISLSLTLYMLWTYYQFHVWGAQGLLSDPSRGSYLVLVCCFANLKWFLAIFAHSIIILCFFCAQSSGNFLEIAFFKKRAQFVFSLF